MTFLAVAMIAINSAICLYLFYNKCKINSPFQFFYLSLFSLSIFPSLFDINIGNYVFHPFAAPINLTDNTIFSIHARIFPMLVSLLLVEKMMDMGKYYENIKIEKIDPSGSIYTYIPIISVFVIMYGAYSYGFSTLASVDFSEIRSGRIGALAISIFYLQIVIVGIPGFFILYSNKKYIGISVLILFLFIYLLIGGSRQVIVMSCAIILALSAYKMGKFRYFILIAVFTVGFSFMDFSLQLVKVLRNLPSVNDRFAFMGDVISGAIPISSLTSDQIGSESTIRYVMYGFLSDPPPPEFGHLEYFKRTLLFWLPSFLDVFSIKPKDFEQIMFAEAMGNRSGTMHASFFGSAYADAKNFAIIWVIWFVILFRFLERLMIKFPPLERAMLWGSCVYLSFMVSRGSFYAPVVITAIVLLISFLSKKYSEAREKNHP